MIVVAFAADSPARVGLSNHTFTDVPVTRSRRRDRPKDHVSTERRDREQPLNVYENRFVERLQFVVGDAELGQEYSIPRKARRLDYVCRFEEPPAVFGALREHCCHRTVLFEHASQPLAGHSVASGWPRDSSPCSATPACLSPNGTRSRKPS